MDFKDSKWADKIIKLQQKDGSWGYFHSLSNPTPKQPMTTEQALRRLMNLGFTIDDKPIKKVVKYMSDCLIGKNKIPDREEKRHNWDIYTSLMLSTWIKIFTKENNAANNTSKKWSEIINNSFAKGNYNNNIYVNTYESIFRIKMNPKAGRLIDFVHFYPISLLTNNLDKKIEPIFFNYVLNHECGIYYIWDKKIINTPELFKSKNANRYVSAIELLAEYNNKECKKQLEFINKWLSKNMIEKNKWDMGKEAKDGINFPLSDSWRKEEDRINDCTYRINRLLEKIGTNCNFA